MTRNQFEGLYGGKEPGESLLMAVPVEPDNRFTPAESLLGNPSRGVFPHKEFINKETMWSEFAGHSGLIPAQEGRIFIAKTQQCRRFDSHERSFPADQGMEEPHIL